MDASDASNAVARYFGEVSRIMAVDFPAAVKRAKALIGDPESKFAGLTILAYLNSRQGAYEEASETLMEALALEPDVVETHFNLAYCRQQLGAFADAAQTYRAANRHPVLGPDAVLLEALCWFWSGDRKSGLSALESAGQGFPDHPATRFFQARIMPTGAELLREWAHGREAELLAFVNRYDLPCWRVLDDKAELTALIGDYNRHRPETGFGYYPLSGRLPEDYERLASARNDGKAGPWIAKPARLFGGQGNVIAADLSGLPQESDWIAQRYIHPPMLVNGRKAHLRLYLALVPGEDRLWGYLYGNGVVRFAPAPYSTSDLAVDDESQHITNTQRHKVLAGTEVPRVVDLLTYLKDAAEEGQNPQNLGTSLYELSRALYPIMEVVFERSSASTSCPAALPPKLFGLDLLFDAEGRPWLLEIERYPALSGGAPAAESVNARLFTDFFELVVSGADTTSAGAWASLRE